MSFGWSPTHWPAINYHTITKTVRRVLRAYAVAVLKIEVRTRTPLHRCIQWIAKWCCIIIIERQPRHFFAFSCALPIRAREHINVSHGRPVLVCARTNGFRVQLAVCIGCWFCCGLLTERHTDHRRRRHTNTHTRARRTREKEKWINRTKLNSTTKDEIIFICFGCVCDDDELKI